jgi:hypothetical protein
MERRGNNDIPAGCSVWLDATRVKAGTEVTGTTADALAGPGKEELTSAPAGPLYEGLRQWAVPTDQGGERLFATRRDFTRCRVCFGDIHIENPNAGFGPSWDANPRVRVAGVPATDDLRVRGGCVEAACLERTLVASNRKDGDAPAGVSEGRINDARSTERDLDGVGDLDVQWLFARGKIGLPAQMI